MEIPSQASSLGSLWLGGDKADGAYKAATWNRTYPSPAKIKTELAIAIVACTRRLGETIPVMKSKMSTSSPIRETLRTGRSRRNHSRDHAWSNRRIRKTKNY